MIGCAERVLTYTAEFDRAAFVASALHRDATPQIPWRLIIATRNRLIHGDLGIGDDLPWSIIRDHGRAFLPQLRELRARPGEPDAQH